MDSAQSRQNEGVVPYALGEFSGARAETNEAPQFVAKILFGTAELQRDRSDSMLRQVIQLEQAAEAPIQLVLHGNLLAKGELVSCSGQLGVRIIEVADEVRQQAMSSEEAHAA